MIYNLFNGKRDKMLTKANRNSADKRGARELGNRAEVDFLLILYQKEFTILGIDENKDKFSGIDFSAYRKPKCSNENYHLFDAADFVTFQVKSQASCEDHLFALQIKGWWKGNGIFDCKAKYIAFERVKDNCFIIVEVQKLLYFLDNILINKKTTKNLLEAKENPHTVYLRMHHGRNNYIGYDEIIYLTRDDIDKIGIARIWKKTDYLR